MGTLYVDKVTGTYGNVADLILINPETLTPAEKQVLEQGSDSEIIYVAEHAAKAEDWLLQERGDNGDATTTFPLRSYNPEDVKCFNCNRTPEQAGEYGPEQTGENIEPLEFVIQNEGTFNHTNGHFCCTKCYIEIGMPSNPWGWHAP